MKTTLKKAMTVLTLAGALTMGVSGVASAKSINVTPTKTINYDTIDSMTEDYGGKYGYTEVKVLGNNGKVETYLGGILINGENECKVELSMKDFIKNGANAKVKTVGYNRTTTNACKAMTTYNNNKVGLVGTTQVNSVGVGELGGVFLENGDVTLRKYKVPTKLVTKKVKGKKVTVATTMKSRDMGVVMVVKDGKYAKQSAKGKFYKYIYEQRTVNMLKKNYHTKQYKTPTITYHNDDNDKYDILTIKNAKKGGVYVVQMLKDKTKGIKTITQVQATKNGDIVLNIPNKAIVKKYAKLNKGNSTNTSKYELRVYRTVLNDKNDKNNYLSEASYVSLSDKYSTTKDGKKTFDIKESDLDELLDGTLSLDYGEFGFFGKSPSLKTQTNTKKLSNTAKKYKVQYVINGKETSLIGLNEKITAENIKVMREGLEKTGVKPTFELRVYDTTYAMNKQRPVVIAKGTAVYWILDIYKETLENYTNYLKYSEQN